MMMIYDDHDDDDDDDDYDDDGSLTSHKGEGAGATLATSLKGDASGGRPTAIADLKAAPLNRGTLWCSPKGWPLRLYNSGVVQNNRSPQLMGVPIAIWSCKRSLGDRFRIRTGLAAEDACTSPRMASGTRNGWRIPSSERTC